jgi:hypothetical protein
MTGNYALAVTAEGADFVRRSRSRSLVCYLALERFDEREAFKFEIHKYHSAWRPLLVCPLPRPPDRVSSAVIPVTLAFFSNRQDLFFYWKPARRILQVRELTFDHEDRIPTALVIV